MTNIVRYYDWPIRFEAFVKQKINAPFCWGKNDCSAFCADFVLQITGRFLTPANLRGHGTAKSALRALESSGGLSEAVTSVLGAPVPVLTARIGDLALVNVGRHQAIGICNGDTVIGPGRSGIVAVSMLCAVSAWRVG